MLRTTNGVFHQMNVSKGFSRHITPFLLASLICHGVALGWGGVRGMPTRYQHDQARLWVTLMPKDAARPAPEVAPQAPERPPENPAAPSAVDVSPLPSPPPIPIQVDVAPKQAQDNGAGVPELSTTTTGTSPLSLNEYPELDQLTLRPMLRSAVNLPFPPDDGSPPRHLMIAVLINEDGGVDEVLREGGDLPDRYWEVIRLAFLRARYSPAQKDGIPSRSRLHIEVELLRPDRPAVPAPPTAPKSPSEEVPR